MIKFQKLNKNITSVLIAFLFVQTVFGQFTIPEKPKLQTSVYDYAKLLSAAQKTSLENKLIHSIEDGSGMVKYAVCADGCNCDPIDLHYHFYCSKYLTWIFLINKMGNESSKLNQQNTEKSD
mgnify:CR=1 FL=1